MKIIRSIEIKHFRSFLGTPQPYKTAVCELTDLNIFSGANDSGKSNILRALNLFFNDRISSEIPFDFDRDFFMGKKDAGHKVIEIGISFDLSGDKARDKFLPEKFKISRFYNRLGFRNSLYSFNLKGKEIRIDSRAENNERVKDLFLPENPSEEEKRRAAKREWNYRVKFSGFLNKSISFEYVPAIRDKGFFAHLFGRVITQIKRNEDREMEELKNEKGKISDWKNIVKNKKENKDFLANLKNDSWRTTRLEEINNSEQQESKLTVAISNLEERINQYSAGLIKSIDFMDSEFKIGKNLTDFFEGFDIGTGMGKAISLKLRGDGVQAKFVPKILNFLTAIDFEKRYFIWGFEEPENSAEYKNQRELAEEFKAKFSENVQIFLTTHSEEFLRLYDGQELMKNDRTANLYHVKKMRDNQYAEYSQVFLFEVEKNDFSLSVQKNQLEDDLGQSYLRARYSKELKDSEEKFFEKIKMVQNEIALLRERIHSSQKPMVFVEDEIDELYKIAWLKLYGKKCGELDFAETFEDEAPFLIYRAEGASCLAGFLRQKNLDHVRGRKVLGVFDFDEEGVKQFKLLNNEDYWKVLTAGEKTKGLTRKRKDHDCFFAMLIPVPPSLTLLADLEWPSFVEIENLLPETFLVANGFANKVTTTGNTEYFEVKKNKKQNIWKKSLELEADDFNNFVPFFHRIYEIFDLKIKKAAHLEALV